jgi:hypothetical protein
VIPEMWVLFSHPLDAFDESKRIILVCGCKMIESNKR